MVCYDHDHGHGEVHVYPGDSQKSFRGRERFEIFQGLGSNRCLAEWVTVSLRLEYEYIKELRLPEVVSWNLLCGLFCPLHARHDDFKHIRRVTRIFYSDYRDNCNNFVCLSRNLQYLLLSRKRIEEAEEHSEHGRSLGSQILNYCWTWVPVTFSGCLRRKVCAVLLHLFHTKMKKF